MLSVFLACATDPAGTVAGNPLLGSVPAPERQEALLRSAAATRS